MPDSFFALQAQALTYTDTSNASGWITIAKAANTSHDVLITSLRILLTSNAASGTCEIAVEPSISTDANIIFKAEGHGEFYPTYQVFSKDSPCYLTAATAQGNGNQIRLRRTIDTVRYWVSYVKLSENTGTQTWGNMI